jgi:hypothetical protein
MSRRARSAEFIKEMPQFLAAQGEAAEAAAAAQAVKPVVDEETAAVASDALVKVSTALKRAEKLRKDAKDPYQETGRKIDAEFSEVKSPLEGIEARLKQEILTYQERLTQERAEAARKAEEHQREEEAATRKREEEQRKREEEAKAAGTAPPEPPPPPPEPPPPLPAPAPRVRHTGGGSVGVRRVWKFEVFDPSLLPREYTEPAMGALRQAVNDGERNIPGVRIYQDGGVNVRGRRG